jgi:hypothetical protein
MHDLIFEKVGLCANKVTIRCAFSSKALQAGNLERAPTVAQRCLGHELRIWVHIRNYKNFDFAQIGVRIIGVILECCLDVKSNS